MAQIAPFARLGRGYLCIDSQSIKIGVLSNNSIGYDGGKSTRISIYDPYHARVLGLIATFQTPSNAEVHTAYLINSNIAANGFQRI